MIFQNAITVIIFVVNSPVYFVSALTDQGNDFLIFFSSIKKKYLFQLIHFYRLWQAIIQYNDSPDNVTQMIVNDDNCETKETYEDEVIIMLFTLHFNLFTLNDSIITSSLSSS